jgi:hypothetical protein
LSQIAVLKQLLCCLFSWARHFWTHHVLAAAAAACSGPCSSHFTSFYQFYLKQRQLPESSASAPCAFLFTTPSAAMASAFVHFSCGGQRPYSPSHLPACQPPHALHTSQHPHNTSTQVRLTS